MLEEFSQDDLSYFDHVQNLIPLNCSGPENDNLLKKKHIKTITVNHKVTRMVKDEED